MKVLTTALAAVWLTLAAIPAAQAQAQAQTQSSPVVVELFTSQGCSSCPPADGLMHKLAARDDVIALSMHVDYWDYIGWKDEFGRAENTARQKAYARAAGRRSIYTPQMIISGTDSVVGTQPMDVADLLRKHAQAPSNVTLKVERVGGALKIAASARNAATYDVALVRFMPKRTTAIKRGENAGKTLTYVNVVSDLTVIETWDGRAPLAVTVKSGAGPAAILIQRAGHGQIDAAAQVK